MGLTGRLGVSEKRKSHSPAENRTTLVLYSGRLSRYINCALQAATIPLRNIHIRMLNLRKRQSYLDRRVLEETGREGVDWFAVTQA